MYIVLAIVIFGVLVFTHELGHFFAAKACGVRVNEFSVGMGPAILKRTRGETQYSLRILPVGGFCAMEGEEENSGDPRAFTSQSVWKRLVILAAGAAMNFITGLLIVTVLFSGATSFLTPHIAGFLEGFPCEGEDGLMAGDRIVSINGSHVFYAEDFSTYMARSNGESVDMTVLRDGRRVKLQDLPITLREYESNGQTRMLYGVTFYRIEANAAERLKYSCYTSYNFVRMVWMGLTDIVSGAIGMRELSGPVGIVSIINDVGEASPSAAAALYNIAYLAAFLAVNLAVMNMLPLPALDGGRIFLLIVTQIAQRLTGRSIDPRYEAYIHVAGMILLFGLMAFVMVNDVLKITVSR